MLHAEHVFSLSMRFAIVAANSEEQMHESSTALAKNMSRMWFATMVTGSDTHSKAQSTNKLINGAEQSVASNHARFPSLRFASRYYGTIVQEALPASVPILGCQAT